MTDNCLVVEPARWQIPESHWGSSTHFYCEIAWMSFLGSVHPSTNIMADGVLLLLKSKRLCTRWAHEMMMPVPQGFLWGDDPSCLWGPAFSEPISPNPSESVPIRITTSCPTSQFPAPVEVLRKAVGCITHHLRTTVRYIPFVHQATSRPLRGTHQATWAVKTRKPNGDIFRNWPKKPAKNMCFQRVLMRYPGYHQAPWRFVRFVRFVPILRWFSVVFWGSSQTVVALWCTLHVFSNIGHTWESHQKLPKNIPRCWKATFLLVDFLNQTFPESPLFDVASGLCLGQVWLPDQSIAVSTLVQLYGHPRMLICNCGHTPIIVFFVN